MDPATVAILRDVQRAAQRLNADVLLIGASARDYWLHTRHSIRVGRATEDYDLAVIVESWDAYQQLTEALVKTGQFCQDSHQQQRLYAGDLTLDLVPFGALESPPGNIAWPPAGNIVMSTLGFRDALAAGETINIGSGTSFKVATLPSLVLLKLVAWNDRHKSKDAYDVTLIAQNYTDAGHFERLTDAGAPLIEIFEDIQVAGAALLGQDIRAIASDETLEIACKILSDAIGYHDGGRFLIYAADAIVDSESAEEITARILSAILHGMRSL
jgi:predicted nucleotidyltransferase